MTEADWDRVVSVNLKGTFFCCRYAIPELRKTQGCIVNLSSDAGVVGHARDGGLHGLQGRREPAHQVARPRAGPRPRARQRRLSGRRHDADAAVPGRHLRRRRPRGLLQPPARQLRRRASGRASSGPTRWPSSSSTWPARRRRRSPARSCRSTSARARATATPSTCDPRSCDAPTADPRQRTSAATSTVAEGARVRRWLTNRSSTPTSRTRCRRPSRRCSRARAAQRRGDLRRDPRPPALQGHAGHPAGRSSPSAHLRKHVQGLLDRTPRCVDYLNFCGAGCWQHHVPAVVDEIINRAEFLSAYCGGDYSDLGKYLTRFEFNSSSASCSTYDGVANPIYDWGDVAGRSFRMARRITGRDTVLVPAHMSPMRLMEARTLCQPEVMPRTAPRSASTSGTARPAWLDLDDLRAKLDDAVRRRVLGEPRLPRHHRGPRRRDRAPRARSTAPSPSTASTRSRSACSRRPAPSAPTSPAATSSRWACTCTPAAAAPASSPSATTTRCSPRSARSSSTRCMETATPGEYAGGRGAARAHQLRRPRPGQGLGRHGLGSVDHRRRRLHGGHGPAGLQGARRDLHRALALRGQEARPSCRASEIKLSPSFFKEFVVNFDGTGKTRGRGQQGPARPRHLRRQGPLEPSSPSSGQSALYCVTEYHDRGRHRRSCVERPQGGAVMSEHASDELQAKLDGSRRLRRDGGVLRDYQRAALGRAPHHGAGHARRARHARAARRRRASRPRSAIRGGLHARGDGRAAAARAAGDGSSTRSCATTCGYSQMTLGMDLGSDISEGTCTMKYSPKVHEELVRYHRAADLHPWQDEDTLQGLLQIVYELRRVPEVDLRHGRLHAAARRRLARRLSPTPASCAPTSRPAASSASATR